MHYLTCPQCQSEFATKDKRAKYCSKPCSNSGRAREKQRLVIKTTSSAKKFNPINKTVPIAEINNSVSTLDDDRPFDVTPSDGSPTYIQFTLNGKEYAESGKRWAAETKEKDVITLAGNGCSLQVDKGQLVLRSGFGCSTVPDRERRFSRGVHAIRAIIVLNTTGSLSTAAIQWCADQRIALYILDRDANLTALTHPHTPHVISLRRLQYLVEPVALAKEILSRKLKACQRIKPELAETLTPFFASIGKAEALESLRLFEARAAIIYWTSWNSAIKWKEKDVPVEWKSFTQRASGISGKGYKATHPVNALLNYAYAILAGQVERVLQIAGLDVAVGSLHSDQDGRASLVFDLMEPLRPQVDRVIFSWVAAQRWRRSDFVVDRQGVIRMHPQLARVVVTKALLPDGVIRDEINAYVGLLKRLGDKPLKLATQQTLNI
ncbi:CRISPR-associated endonuclease Cas1 [Nitrosomonas sp. Nm166]|uniref:CRISPR-associated endonuclease Cas1 n=1 Tax=Nitrosomonas sp. Nm166 TaxID=1881054 RepID=UPI0008E840F0|nr:CRISPR-associated endonuclease Cas1 [Nitrosomonas sp. Nm166]SFF01769.1 CRISP-associated protein Cas1 [Nitrosomonas sp. Nm166]